MTDTRDSQRLLAELEQLQNQLVQPSVTSVDTTIDIPVLDDVVSQHPIANGDTSTPSQTVLSSSVSKKTVTRPSTHSEHLALLQQEALIDGLIDDMLPLIKSRLRDRIRQILEEE